MFGTYKFTKYPSFVMLIFLTKIDDQEERQPVQTDDCLISFQPVYSSDVSTLE